jgi:hypothetical protein
LVSNNDSHVNLLHQPELTLLSGDSLCRKWNRAKDGIAETKPAFEQLTECLDVSLVQEWTEQECIAMEKHGDHMKIYDVALKKCREILLCTPGWYDMEFRFYVVRD